MNQLINSLPQATRARVSLLVKSLKTPMIAFTGLRIVEDSNLLTEVLVPLSWRTKNSWDTMFFAAIGTGVDITGGWCAMDIAEQQRVGLLYKDVSIRFHRRVDSDLSLICRSVSDVHSGVRQAVQSGERVNVPVVVEGFCYAYSRQKPVVTAQLTLSLKKVSS
jgi:hypothetical protein